MSLFSKYGYVYHPKGKHEVAVCLPLDGKYINTLKYEYVSTMLGKHIQSFNFGKFKNMLYVYCWAVNITVLW